MNEIYEIVIDEISRFEKNLNKLPLQIAKQFHQKTFPILISCIKEQKPFPNSLRVKYVEGSNKEV